MKVKQYFLIYVVIIAMLTGVVSAVSPEYGTALIDGEADEWVDYSDPLQQPLVTDVCRLMTDGTSSYARECIRYDCDKKKVYVFLWDEVDIDNNGLYVVSDQSKAFIDGNVQYSSPIIYDSGTPYFKWWMSNEYSAWGYEASFDLDPGSYSFYTQAEFVTPDVQYFTVSTPPETLDIICGGVTPAPEFPSIFLPATMIIGFLGAVLLIQRTREH